jgi:filamentous hemagglutinin family protein
MDVGCAQLIIDGKVKMKSKVEIDFIDKEGIVFNDGSRIDADIIVLA